MPSKILVEQIAHTNETSAIDIDSSGNMVLQKELKFNATAAIKNSAGNAILQESGGNVTLSNVRLPASGGISDSSGNAVLSESGGTVTLNKGTLGSAVNINTPLASATFPSEFKRSTVQKSDGHNESLGDIFFDSPAYVEWYDLNVGDKIVLEFVGGSTGKWWIQGRWAPSGFWGCYIDTNGGSSPNFGNTWSANDGDYGNNTYEKRILFGSNGNITGNGDTSTFAFDTNSFTFPSTLRSDHNYFIAGDANNLPGNSMSTDMSRTFIFEVPTGFAGSYRFHRVVFASYWQDVNGTFYPFGDANQVCYMNSWKFIGVT